ncbi:unnamed protein product [Caenorhabditis bovis]|uniref:Cyclic nucleotide-binding domain-containing protein n=1 Tax=Caenorhabditis bovis TaxID=2654633 RepID=A0A8S1F8V0_9PELO|nr:unnamed protein product [Caenorhabditis bovis]
MPTTHKKRLLASRKSVSVDLLPQHYEYENEYEKWKKTQPEIKLELSIDEFGVIYWIWSFSVVLGCLYNILILSVLAFEDVRDSYLDQWVPVNFYFDLVFLFDIVVRSMLNFYDQGVLVTEYVETSKKYFKSIYAIVDFLAIVPFDLLVIRKTSSAFCRLNRLLKLYRIRNFVELSYGKLSQVTISLTQIIAFCFLLFHCNACVFYIISVNSDLANWKGLNATFDDDELLPWPYMAEKITDAYLIGCDGQDHCYNEDFYFDEEREQHLIELYHHWMSENRTMRIKFSKFTKEYTVSMYWSAMTMTTLGEQPSPDTSLQNLFEVLNTIAGLLLFAVIMGSVGDLVANANKVKTYWQTLMDGLKQYMTYRNLNMELQNKVLKFCEYEMAEETILKEHEVRDELPTKLYGHVTKSIIGNSLVNSPIFQISERCFLNEISELLEPHYFSPGDVVVEKGQLCTSMFIIVSGKMIEVKGDERIEHVEGEVLCDANLFWFENHIDNNRHLHNIIATAFSQVHILNRDDFFKVLEAYDVSLKRRLCDAAYRIQKGRGELNNRPKKMIEAEDIESNFKRLAAITLDIERNLTALEKQILIFTQSTKRRVYIAERNMCSLLRNKDLL